MWVCKKGRKSNGKLGLNKTCVKVIKTNFKIFRKQLKLRFEINVRKSDNNTCLFDVHKGVQIWDFKERAEN